MLGLDRSLVVHKRFAQFVAMDHRVLFADFCRRVLAADAKQTCEVKILKDGQTVDAMVEGIAAQDCRGQRKLCRAAVIDITQQKRTDELAEANRALRSEIAAARGPRRHCEASRRFPTRTRTP